MNWQRSHRFDSRVVPLADRHYNRQTPGSPQFSPPGRLLVLRTPEGGAYWTTSWPLPEFTKHAWPGAWICSAFRNERRDLYLSSALIREAVSCTLAWFGNAPPLGMVTFVDREKTRRKRDPGRCFLRAGFVVVGETKVNRLIVLQLLADAMPAPEMPLDDAPLFAPHP